MNHDGNRHLRLVRAFTSIFAACCTLVLALTAPGAAYAQSGVSITEGSYEGRAQFVVTTTAATYYFDKLGGGFSRIIDRDGKDWIAFHKDPLSTYPDAAAAGFRGMPNTVFGGTDNGAGHPGFNQVQTVAVGGNRLVTTSNSGKWQWTWQFEATYAALTINRADPDRPYWFLYEGTPGGRYSPANQYWGTDATGLRTDAPDHMRGTGVYANFQWAYFGDSSVNRILFVSQVGQDQVQDTFSYMGSTTAGTDAPNGMTIFGFGRGSDLQPKMVTPGNRFIIGLIEQSVNNATQHGSVSTTIGQITQAVASTPAVFEHSAQIDVWYGTEQTFGHLGVPQTAINIPGTLTMTQGQLSYRLNGGPVRSLGIGPDHSRLERAGDFNLDIPVSDLVAGPNQVVITATNPLGYTLQKTVTVNYQAGHVWPLPYAIDWTAATSVQQVTQVVDGRWHIAGNTVRTTEMGYDRLLAIGDLSWSNYEVTVPFTVHAINYLAQNPPLVGVFTAWRGHHVDQLPQPADGWWQSGGFGYYRWYSADNSNARLELMSATDGGLVTDPNFRLQMGTTYVIKVRTSMTPAGMRQYAMKLWPQASAEPASWQMTLNGVETPPGGGSLMLMAHFADVSFGAVAVTPLTGSNTPPPVISGASATQIAANSARIAWTTNVAATSSVSYGRTTAYELGTLSNSTPKTAHAIDLAGLLPLTRYYFRVSSAGTTGAVATVAGQFDTVAAGAPPPPIVSDDFSSATLNTNLWTFVNPRQDATLQMNGTQAVISVPAGVSHDLWTGGAQAPRLMQPAANTDFSIEAKFESAVAAAYQMQGLVVEQDANTLLRFDVYSDGAGVALFAATIGGGSASTRFNTSIPQSPRTFLRLVRAGNQWTLSYSPDGGAWQAVGSFNHQLDVRSVGVFAGNAGVSPAHSAVIDYFFNSAAPIPGEDGGAAYAVAVTVTGQGQVTKSPNASSYPAGQVVQLTAVPAAGWQFAGWSGDASGTNATTTVTVSRNHAVSALFVSGTPSDTTPPVISSLQVATTATDATVTWTTNEPATSAVSFGPTSAYALGTVSDQALRTSHSIRLTGVSPGTSYRFRASSRDAAGNTANTPDSGFTTSAAPSSVVSDDFSAPTLDTSLWRFVDPRGGSTARVTGLQAAIDVPAGVTHDLWTGANHAPRLLQSIANGDFGIEAKFESAVTIAYQLQGLIVEQDASRFLRFDTYSDGGGVMLFAATFDGGAPVVRVNTRIAAAQTPHLRIRRAGNAWTLSYSTTGSSWQTVASFNFTLTAVSAGVFAGNAGNAPAYSAVIDYFFNSDAPISPEDSGVYALTTAVVGSGTISRSPNKGAYTAGEQVQLTAAPAAGSRFVGWSGAVTGTNPSALLVVSGPHSVTATFALLSDTTAPAISNVQVSSTSSVATVTWTTNEPATSAVSFGPTSAYERGTVQDATLRTSHSVQLGGLTGATAYHYRVASTDAAGNAGVRPDAVFTTQGDASALVSDDFTGQTLNTGRWIVVNPRNDAAFRMTGTQLAIDVPAGASHDVWTDGNFAPRVMQSIVNADFTMQVKFDSAVTQAYQLQGLVIEQDATRFLRFDVYSHGAGAAAFAATFANGTPTQRANLAVVPGAPVYLRIQRAGNTWTLSYSTNGTSWQSVATFTHSLTVTAAGVFAGNAGAAPAHTALIDYVFNNAAPISPQD